MLIDIIMILAGFGIAMIATTVGIGGGILWTPLLIFAYGLSPVEAVACSMLIQTAGLGSGTIAFIRNKSANLKLSFTIFLFALPGVIIGSLSTQLVSADMLKLILGVMAMMLAIMFVSQHKEAEGYDAKSVTSKELAKLAPIPGFFGLLMGLLSLGISEWLIPALRERLQMTMAQAVATMIPAMFMLVLVADIIHLSHADRYPIEHAMWGAVGTLFGAQYGVHIAKRINERLLKESFIYLMTLVGVHFIYHSI